MKQQAAIEVLRVPILPFGMVNAHALLTDRGCVLVDAGLPGSRDKFERALAKHGRSLRDVTAIVITHAHIDHVGGAAQLREASGAPVIAHIDERPYLSGERPIEFCPTGPGGHLLLASGLPRDPYERIVPDIYLDSSRSLDEFGVGGRIVPTPGHTPGSISVVLPDGAALVGDMVAGGILIGGVARHHHATRPPFEESPQEVANELERLLEAGADTFHLGHGGPVDKDEVARHLRALRALGEAPPRSLLQR